MRGDTLHGEHVSLNDLVMFAYNLRGLQLSGGPAWGIRGELDKSELYQVTAKAAGDPPPALDQFRLMLQTLLTDRFHLEVHHVQKDLPVYNLVVNRGGPKLRESPAGTKSTANVRARGNRGIHIEATGMTMPNLVGNQLSGYSGRPVFDKTGLTGSYDFTLDFYVESLAAGPDAVPEGPSLLTALQEELGLKLEPATAPFDTVVIDHAERPSEN